MTHAPVPGIYRNIPFDEYRQWDAANQSRLSKLDRSPAHMKAYLDAPQHETPALKLGKAIGAAILEPDSFAATFVTAGVCSAIKKGDGKPCTNVGILFRGDFGWLCGVHGKGLAGDESRVILDPDDMAICLGARDSVHRHRAAGALLTRITDTNRELSMVWVDRDDVGGTYEPTGVLCKARFDGMVADFADGVIVDVKSTEDASKSAFERSIYKYGYHRQGAHYLSGATANGLSIAHYLNIAVEKEPPYACAVYQLSDATIEMGREQQHRALMTYARCLETGHYPAYSDDVEEITLPAFAFSQIDDRLREAVS